jgi:hypothetical protein
MVSGVADTLWCVECSLYLCKEFVCARCVCISEGASYACTENLYARDVRASVSGVQLLRT